MSVVRKFALSLGSMLALILFVSAMGFAALEILGRRATDIVADSMRMQRLALEVDSRLQLARHVERDLMLHAGQLGKDEERAIYANEFQERLAEAARNVAWLNGMQQYSVNRRDTVESYFLLQELLFGLEHYGENFRQLVEIMSREGGDAPAFMAKSAEVESDFQQLNAIVRELAVSAANGAENASRGIDFYSNLVKYALVASVVFAMLLAFSIIWVLNRAVTRSVVKLRDAATELSLGNMEARADIRTRDEFGQLGMSINSMAVRMTALINNLESEASTASGRLLEAINAVSQGFLFFDRDGVLVLANDRIREIVGKDNDVLEIGVHVDEMLHRMAWNGLFTDAIGREEAWVKACSEHMNMPGHELEQQLLDRRWVHTKIFHTDGGEKVIVVSDITERKNTERNLSIMNSDLEDLVRDRTKVLVEKALELKAANARLRELDELKSAFLSSVSHELRTPLTSLLGFAKIIKRDFRRIFLPLAQEDKAVRLGTRIQTNLDIIGSEGERLTRLINDVLDLSRIESGNENWLFEDVDMNRAVNRAVNSTSGVFAYQADVELEIRRFDMVPLVNGDPDRLQQVFINLLSNAAKFTDKGTVSVDLYLDEQSLVHVCVEDTGRGIEPEYLERIFDKFHQVQKDDTLTEKPAGTGLGLAICRQIVEHYGGRIWAESKPGKGTSIHVTMPPVLTEGLPVVLVVDDDEAARSYLGAVLKRAGYAVRLAADGNEALKLAGKFKPDLITMDLFMPGMSGREAIVHLREDAALADIPILVVSVAEDAHAAGGDAALVKPVHGNAFLGAVNALLGRESAHPVLALRASDNACGMPVMGNDCVECRDEQELWERLESGFSGTVAVSESVVEGMDLARICAMPHVQLLLIPTPCRAA